MDIRQTEKRYQQVIDGISERQRRLAQIQEAQNFSKCNGEKEGLLSRMYASIGDMMTMSEADSILKAISIVIF